MAPCLTSPPSRPPVSRPQPKPTTCPSNSPVLTISERHDREQYFWNRETIDTFLTALQAWTLNRVCCLCTPTLAHVFWTEHQREEYCLDIDERFAYIPGWRYFDLLKPEEYVPSETEEIGVVVFDPPFFSIPVEQMKVAIERVLGLHNESQRAVKMIAGFRKRDSKKFLEVFAGFGLKRTKTVLGYVSIKTGKWANYTLFSNVDLPGIRRL